MITTDSALFRLTTWVLTSKGRVGTEVQCVGLARALGLNPELKRVSLRFPWSILPEPFWFLPFEAYSSKGDTLSPPWPDILIASGRSATPVAAEIYRASRRDGQRGTFVIAIQDPRLPLKYFDMVIVPRHSGVKGSNVVETHGSLHGITVAQLQAAKEKFSHFGYLPSPRVVVLIGGKNSYYHFSKEACMRLVQQLEGLADQGYALLVSSSRRTPDRLQALLQQRLSQKENVTYWYGQPEQQNPYRAMLGWADAIIVTADSVSMLTEACFTGKPVYIYPLPKKGLRVPRLHQFHQHLISIDAARLFTGSLDPYTPTQLDDLTAVTSLVLEKLQQHFTF